VHIIEEVFMVIVAAAIMCKDKKVFIAKRPEGKSLAHHWEFPGGKQEKGESLQQTLQRELKEELGINVDVGDFFMRSVYEYEFGQIDMNCFWVQLREGEVVEPKEHEEVAWVRFCDLEKYCFAPADIPVVDKLKTLNVL